jgi:hypothetical protein
MKMIAGALCLATLITTPALAETCQSAGDPKARSVAIPSPNKDVMGFTAWGWLLADALDSIRVNRVETCSRGPFRLGSQVFRMSGENGEPVPRKALSEDPDGPVAMLVPFDIQRMRMAFPGLAPSGKTPVYIIVVLDSGVLTVERILQGIPKDEVLIGEFGLALTKVNTMARLAPGDPKAGIVIHGDSRKGAGKSSP